MVTIKVRNREDEIRDIINLWLQVPGRSCARCGQSEREGEACCDSPALMTNAGILRAFTQDIRVLRITRANKYASDAKKDMRFALSFPVGLLKTLEDGMKHLHNEPLFTEDYPVSWFVKKFGKFFSIPEEY